MGVNFRPHIGLNTTYFKAKKIVYWEENVIFAQYYTYSNYNTATKLMSNRTKHQPHSSAEEKHTTGELIGRGEQFVEKHLNTMLYIALGVIVIAFGIWAYVKYVHQPRGIKAANTLFPAEEQFISGADSAALYPTGVGTAGLLDVTKKYGGRKAGNLAHAYAGICFYDMGQYEKAIQELKKFKSKEQMVAPSITRLIGDCHVQLGQLPEAAKLFMQAAKEASNPVVSPGCLIKAGRVYEELGQLDKALQSYKTIKDTYYSSPELREAEAAIIRVEAAQEAKK